VPFPEDLGTITCRCVLDDGRPVLFASHAGGDWQMYCHYNNHDFGDEDHLEREMRLVHIVHLVARDPSLNELADLPVDMGAERLAIGAQWQRFEDLDDA
jgi:hypothetical protein